MDRDTLYSILQPLLVSCNLIQIEEVSQYWNERVRISQNQLLIGYYQLHYKIQLTRQYYTIINGN